MLEGTLRPYKIASMIVVRCIEWRMFRLLGESLEVFKMLLREGAGKILATFISILGKPDTAFVTA